MAIFTNTGIKNIDSDSLNDVADIKAYLFQLNESLKFMFSNIEPGDNYSKKAIEESSALSALLKNFEDRIKRIETHLGL